MATLAEVVAGLSGTHAEVYEQVKARTVSALGKIWGADVQKVMASAGLLGLIQDTVIATGTYSGFRDMCIAMKDRFGAGGEIDFTDAYTLAFMMAGESVPRTKSRVTVTVDLVRGKPRPSGRGRIARTP